MKGRHLSRKEFLVLGAAGLASAPLLASCGKDLPEVAAGKPIIKENELKPSSAFLFEDAGTGKPRVLVRLGSGELALYSAECTHRGCTVNYKPEEDHLVCPCHHSTFSLLDGGVVSGPAEEPLARLKAEVRDGAVFAA